MTLATLGLGAKLQRGDDASPEVFTTIGEITNIPGVGEDAPDVDVTSHDSSRREYIAGIPDGSEITFQANWSGSATQDHLTGFIKAAQDQEKDKYRLVLISGTTLHFEAQAKGWKILPNLDSQEVLEGSIKVSGAIAFS